MRAVRVKAFAAAAVLSAAGLLSAAARAVGDTTLRDVSRYREWARVADVPAAVPIDLAAVAG